jgi:CRISPR-associated protein Cas6
MFWREEKRREQPFRVPDDVFDLVFRLRGKSIDIDHAHALARALGEHLDAETCSRIGVHGISMASSGNGWNRPEALDAELPLSRRARLVIRVPRELGDEVRRISHCRLRLGRQQLDVGESSVRPLSSLGTVHARAVSCDRDQPEDDFMQQVAAELETMGIEVSRMLCGRAGEIRVGADSLFTRALLVADLKPEESVRLQQRGIGGDRLLGCGLFVPHKEIDAVYEAQERD